MKREICVYYNFPPTKEKTGSHVWDDGIMFVWTEVTPKAGLTKHLSPETSEFVLRNCCYAMGFFLNTPNKFIWTGTITELALGRNPFLQRKEMHAHTSLRPPGCQISLWPIVTFSVAIVNDSMDCSGFQRKVSFFWKEALLSKEQCSIHCFESFRILIIMISWSMHAKLFE